MAKALECEQLNNGDPLFLYDFPPMSTHPHLFILPFFLPWILKCIYVVNIISLLSFSSFSTFRCDEVCLLQAIDDTKRADEL